MPKQKPILIVQHAPHEHPAALRRAIETQGMETLLVHPYLGDPYPKYSSISGMISLGGPMGANDSKKHPWITKECKLLKQCVENNYPTVGICLGAQMLAKTLGGSVEKNKSAEVGWFSISLNSKGKSDPVMGAAGISPLVYHWHQDTFFLPKKAQLLATSEGCPRQAFKVSENIYGFQFHPEADHQLLREWLTIDGVEEEIRVTRKECEPTFIQTSKVQLKHALSGEKSSLKITAAIGQLFQEKEYVPVSETIHEQLESWTSDQTLLLLEFKGSDQKMHMLKGHISNLLSIPKAEVLIFRDEKTLLWPLRLDTIQKIQCYD